MACLAANWSPCCTLTDAFFAFCIFERPKGKAQQGYILCLVGCPSTNPAAPKPWSETTPRLSIWSFTKFSHEKKCIDIELHRAFPGTKFPPSMQLLLASAGWIKTSPLVPDWICLLRTSTSSLSPLKDSRFGNILKKSLISIKRFALLRGTRRRFQWFLVEHLAERHFSTLESRAKTADALRWGRFRLEACIQTVSSIFSGACMAWARLLLLIFGCFFAHSKGDVRQFFRLLFCIWTRF